MMNSEMERPILERAPSETSDTVEQNQDTPEGTKESYDNALVDNYCTLLMLINKSRREGTIDGGQAEELIQQLDNDSERRIGRRISEAEGKWWEAKKIMGKSFLGPDAAETTFGVKIDYKEVPAIPFSAEILERAEKIGAYLIYRTNKDAEGKPLTMQRMQTIIQASSNQSEAVFFNSEGFQQEQFFITETPRSGWALVGKNVPEVTLGRDYAQQTRELSDFVMTNLHYAQTINELPPEYREAVIEFQQAGSEINVTRFSDKSFIQNAIEKLKHLRLVDRLRPTSAEAAYDAIISLQNTGERMLENYYGSTSSWTADGQHIGLGYFNATGMICGTYDCSDFNPDLGALLSLRSE